MTIDKRRPLNLIKMYCLIAAAAIGMCLLYSVVSGRGTDVLDWLVLGTSNDWELADFFRHIGYASDLKQTYYVSNDACFPPLAYLFFHLIYKLNPLPAGIAADNWQAFAMYPYEILFYIHLVIITGILFYELIRRVLHTAQISSSLLMVASAPMFIAIERGNPVFFVTVMLLWALYLKDERERWKKELALVLIAVAAGFKIYPAILGLLYIREKRYAEMRRLIVYGVLLFFVPFLFTGGIAGFQQFLEVLFHGHYTADFMKEWSSVRGLCVSVLTKVGIPAASASMAGTVVENLFLIISVILCFITNDKWKAVLFLSAPMTFYMPTSWCYNMVYYLLPMILFLGEFKKQSTGLNVSAESRNDLYFSRFYTTIYLLLFAAIFSIPIWGLYNSITKLICTPGYTLWFAAVVEELSAFFRRPVENNQKISERASR